MSPRPKVFCLGVHRTGTGTFGKAMSMLGYKVLGWRPAVFDAYLKRRLDVLSDIIGEHDAFHDWPWPLMAEELLQRYPDALFVLTVRKSPEVWLESVIKHAQYAATNSRVREAVYGPGSPIGAEEVYLNFYRRYNREVCLFFETEGALGQLKKFCWENGDGWRELCGFIDVPLPAVKFPHFNRSASGKASHRQ